ncbi:MAG: efflux transporter outer membrane subunit [Pseudomonadota bacterium]
MKLHAPRRPATACEPHPLTVASLTLAAALSLAACGSMAPRYERPALPVAERFPVAPASDARAATATVELPWRQFFAEPRLQRLIELSLANNRDLRIAAANIESAQAQLSVRRADLFPTVGLGASGTRQSGRGGAATTGAAGTAGTGTGTAATAGGGSVTSLYTAGLTVSAYELDLFGRVRSLTDAALAQVAASEEARRTAQIGLVASVANLYYALASDEVLLSLTQRTLDTRRESLRLVQLRFDNGVTSEIDLRAAQTAVENARAVGAQLRRQQQLDRNALELLVGQGMPSDLPPASPWNPQALSDVPAGLPSEVLLQRPDVRQAEAQLRAANANIGAARAAYWPRISLTASVGGASTELSELFSNGTAWSFVPQLFLPLFDAGRNRANERLSEVQRDIAVAQYERSVQTAFREVADALASRLTLAEQLEALTAQADAEAARQRLTELRFTNGVASSLELLDSQRSLFAAEQQRVQVELALLQNRIGAYRALGGGLQE